MVGSMGVDELQALARLTLAALGQWLSDHGSAILVIALAATMAVRLLRRAIPAAISRAVGREASPLTAGDLTKRAATLSSVLVDSARALVLLIALVLVVDELGVNVVPVIAGLGIGGIALGLGAQSLVKDGINGVLILLENQYGHGDLVTVAGVQGWVEEVNLRRTILRDMDGTLHSVPNSEIKVSSNLTRGFSGINLLVPIAAPADVEKAIALIDATGAALAADEALGEKIVQAPHVARIENATAASVDVRVIGRVAPGAQWEVTTALRRRLMRVFEAEGVRFGPLPAPPPPAPPPPGR